ncbi:hypothetical protein PF010_g11330 [Phytophthora fragariae]|uniref:Tyr recombinase domain-containing protein n=2 Tax=Phytophthora fragariae TaxID=53985 RepID=A0A6G0L5X1_9STRA|nr:hypothetical protein PF010_g11330 [Phytophthora fragariae]
MLRSRAVADTTTSTYRVHWKQWTEFSAYVNWSEWLSDDAQDNSTKLGLFASFCWRYGWRGEQRGNKFTTIQLKLASIRWYHKRYVGIELQHAPDFDVLMRGIRRLSGPLAKKQAITPAFLRLLHRRLDFSRPRHRLLWGAVSMGYFFLLRRSEYLLVESGKRNYCLAAANTYFADRRDVRDPFEAAAAVTIGLAGAKNDLFGRGAWRTMHVTCDPVLCPMKALYHLLRARLALQRTEAPYLCVDLSAQEVSRTFKWLASIIGVSPRNYATHSVRIGGTTALLSGKADGLAIKLLGRWMSNSYDDYPQLAAEATFGLSRRMI